MDTFLEKYNLPNLNEEETECLKRPMTTDEIKAEIKKLTAYKNAELDSFTEIYKTLQEEVTAILH